MDQVEEEGHEEDEEQVVEEEGLKKGRWSTCSFEGGGKCGWFIFKGETITFLRMGEAE